MIELLTKFWMWVLGALFLFMSGCTASGDLSGGRASGTYDPGIEIVTAHSLIIRFNIAKDTPKPLIAISEVEFKGEARTDEETDFN